MLTGDIINSSLLSKSDRKKLPDALNLYFTDIKKYFRNSTVGKLELFSGDRWQILVPDPSDSLRIALSIKMLLKSGSKFKSIDTRISIAVGEIDFVNKNNISKSDGPAFRISGRNLDVMEGTLSVSIPDQFNADGLNSIISLLDFILSKNTPKQSFALFGALSGLNQTEISRLWKPPVSQQSISLHLLNSGWNSISIALEYFENKLKDL